MPYTISARGNSAAGENAAVVAAFNALIAALRSGTAGHVDAGGTIIDGKVYGADESIPGDDDQSQGQTW